MAEQVLVRITASQKVRYSQTITMSREDWEELKAEPGRRAADIVQDLINPADVFDADDIDDDFEVVVVDVNGKEIQPADSYTGE